MRIGELAAAAGVSTRTVRHYHHVGVLPEPVRTVAGYRTYALRDLIRLVHARRLVELGLGLDDVRRTLAEDEHRDLGEVLDRIDADLAEQQERIAAQRGRLTALRRRVREGHGRLDDLGAEEVVEFFSRVEAAGATGPGARLDREVLGLLPREEVQRWVGPLLPLLADPEVSARIAEQYAAFDRLADVAADAPTVEAFVTETLAVLPPGYLDTLGPVDVARFLGEGLLQATYDELSPAQASVVQRIIERSREAAEEEGTR